MRLLEGPWRGCSQVGDPIACGCLCQAQAFLVPTRLFPGSSCPRFYRGSGEWELGHRQSLGEAEAGPGGGGSPSTAISFCISWYPVLSSVSKSFCSHSLLYPHKSPRGKMGGRTCHQPVNSQHKGHARAWCCSFVTVPLLTGGETEARRGAVTCLRLQSQRGITGSAPFREHPLPCPRPWSCSTPRPSDALQLRRSGVTHSHIFQAGLLPGWVSPLGKAPRLFCMVRRTREEMTKILLERAAEYSPTFGLQGLGVASGSAKVGVQIQQSKGVAGRQPWNLDLERHWLWTDVGQGSVPLLLAVAV